MKKLRIQDRLLLGFGLFYDYIGRHMLLAGLGSYKASFFVPPKNKNQSIYNAVSKLLKTGYLEKIVKNGVPCLRISGSGYNAWKRDFSFLAMRNKPWDGSWRFVIFDLPEKYKVKRNILRDKLYELGFGQMQKSIYISPFDFVKDMIEFLQNQKLLGYAYVLTAKHQNMGSHKELASRVWKLNQLNKDYAEILEEIEAMNKIKNKTKKDKILRQLYIDLENIIYLDPFLPKGLLPENWLGEKARKTLLSNI